MMGTQERDAMRREQINRMVGLYEKELLKLCFVYLRNMELAKDALQESFLKAYRQFDSYRGESTEKTWITRIAINTCKDIRRSKWYLHRQTDVSVDSLPLCDPPPDETHLDLMSAILQLPERNREVILLKYQQGFTNREISKMLHITSMAVSKRLHRAYSDLKEHLAERSSR